jgi:membrane protease YdiL (CAAX protease family)
MSAPTTVRPAGDRDAAPVADTGLVPFLAVGVAIALGVFLAVPPLVTAGVPLLFAFTGALFGPILVAAVVAVVRTRRGVPNGSWAAVAVRLRLPLPGHPDWPARRAWAVFVAAAVGVLLVEGLLEPVAGVLVAAVPLPIPAVLPALFDPRVALAVPPTEFMGIPLAGAWWVVAVWTVAFVVNIGGEELLWRGYVLPRQEAAFGRWAWLVNGLLWVVAVHAFMWWNLFGLLPTGLVTPYLVQRYGTTWAGVVVHGLGNALWLVLLVVGVVG